MVVFNGAPPGLRILAAVGFCSSFTTFSTAIFESVALACQSYPWLATINTIGTVAVTTAAAAVGLFLSTL